MVQESVLLLHPAYPRAGISANSIFDRINVMVAIAGEKKFTAEDAECAEKKVSSERTTDQTAKERK